MNFQRLSELFIVGSVLRLICVAYSPTYLPLSIADSATENWQRVKEEIFLFHNPNVSNASEALREPPLFLLVWKIVASLELDSLVFCAFELFTFLSFVIFDLCMRNSKDKVIQNLWFPAATFTFCLNPYSIFSFAIHSVGSISTIISILIFICIANDRTVAASCFCALGCYINIYPGYLLFSVISIVYRNPRRLISVLLAFSLVLGGLLALSVLIENGDVSFLKHVYLSNIFALDTKPNLGIFWYMYVEMFDHFNIFFVWTMQVIIFCLCVALSFRFHQDPLFLALVLSLTTGILRPYNSITDFGCSLALAAHWRHLIPYFRNAHIIGLFMGASLILSPLFFFTWLETGTSNANFYFAAAMLHGFARAQIVAQFCSSYLRHQFENRFGHDIELSNGIKIVPKLQSL